MLQPGFGRTLLWGLCCPRLPTPVWDLEVEELSCVLPGEPAREDPAVPSLRGSLGLSGCCSGGCRGGAGSQGPHGWGSPAPCGRPARPRLSGCLYGEDNRWEMVCLPAGLQGNKSAREADGAELGSEASIPCWGGHVLGSFETGNAHPIQDSVDPAGLSGRRALGCWLGHISPLGGPVSSGKSGQGWETTHPAGPDSTLPHSPA